MDAERGEKGFLRSLKMICVTASTIECSVELRYGLLHKYEYEIHYHPGRENMVIDALRRKERVKPTRVQAMAMTIQQGTDQVAYKRFQDVKLARIHIDEIIARNGILVTLKLRFRWVNYLVVLADAAESVSKAIRFECCLASSRGWTKRVKPLGLEADGDAVCIVKGVALEWPQPSRINNVSQINAKVAGRPITIIEASIRRDLLFNDADEIICLLNQAIFDNLSLMGYKGDITKLTFQKALFSPQWKFLIHTIIHYLSSKSTSWDQFPTNVASAVICLAINQTFNFSKIVFDGMIRHLDAKKKFIMYPRFIQVFLDKQLKNIPSPLDHFPTLVLTKKVFSFMIKQGLNFSGHVTPLFPSMLVQVAVEEGEGSAQPTEPQPTPSLAHPSLGDHSQVIESSSRHDNTHSPNIDLEGTGGSEGDQVQLPYDSPLSGGHTSDRAEGGLNLEELFVLCTNLSNRVLALETSKDAQATEILKLKSRIKKLQKKCKPSISHHRAWLRSVSILSMKKNLDKKKSVSKQGRKNVKPGPTLDDSAFAELDVELDEAIKYMDIEEVVNEGSQSKETGELNVTHDIEYCNISTANRTEVSTATPMSPPTTTSVFDNEDITLAKTLLLPKIDLKDKGKGVLEEEPEHAKKLKKSDLVAAQLAMDEEVARQVNAEWQAELERERVVAEEANQAALASEFDEIQARMNADTLLAERLQEAEREQFSIEQRAKFLHDTIAAQRKFLAEQRAVAIRSKPLTKTQLRNQMITFLKHKSIQDFVLIGSAKDERLIEKINKKAAGEDTSKKKKARNQTHADSDDEQNSEEDERKIGSMNKIDARESSDKDGTEIHMLVEKKYPLTKEILKRMMSLKLIAESASDGAYNLLRFIQKQIGEFGSYDGSEKDLKVKELASPKQTTLGKDFSNPLMVDSLPKTIWLSMHHVIAIKHWLFQSKRLLIKKSQKSSSSSKSRLKNSYVFGYILQVIKKFELKKHEEKIQANCDVKETNIILQGLPSDVYALERECKLYDEFDKFAYKKGESLHQCYLKFAQQTNNMNIYKMTLQQFQINTKFLNSLPPKWSKFDMNVKLVRDLHTTNFDQLHAYLQQHELHSSYNNPQFQQQFSPSQSPQYGSIHPSQYYSTTYPSTPHVITYSSASYLNDYSSMIDSGLAVYMFKQKDDPINAINKMMSFLSTVVSSHFPSTNNQLRNSSNPRQQATIHDGIVKLVQGRQSSFAVGEGHMERQCPKPKRKRDATWFRYKVLLVEAQRSGKVLNGEELVFLADPRVIDSLVTQTVIKHNTTYQADDLDAYDSGCDDIFTTKAVLMANLSSYISYVLSELPHSENTHNDMLNKSVQEMSYSEQTHLVNYLKNEITSDSNIIPYSQYLLETKNAAVQDINSSLQQDVMILSLERYKERVKLLEERQNANLSTREKLIMDDIIREKNAQFADFEKEINYLKQTLSEQLHEKELLTKTFNVLKKESKEKKAKNIDKEIALKKKVKELGNILLVFKILSILRKLNRYDGSVIAKETNMISIADSEENLMLEEESRSKMFLKQSDPMVLEKKVNIKLIKYAELNRLSEGFGKRFIPQQELLDEQAFRLQTSHPNTDQYASSLSILRLLKNFLR
ncbi:hypothetical protein Tco_0266593 [Tanacetum coccineum]